MIRPITRVLTAVAAGGLLLFGAASQAQSLGHRVPGTLGIHAGDQPRAGVFVVGQILNYTASSNFDRNGNPVRDNGFDIEAVAGAIGAAVSIQLPRGGPYLGAAVGIPAGHGSFRSDFVQPGVDRGGIGDIYVQPLRVGVKLRYVDLSASYGVYLPTGWYDATGQRGFGNGQVTHEFSAGGTLFLDAEHRFFVSALGSFHLNGPKRTIDITRGATVQVQGGIGARFFRIVDFGLAGYALWQVSDAVGTELPDAFRGLREQVFGIGPEIDIAIPQINAQLSARYGHDVGVHARPQGELLFVGLAWRASDFGAARRREPGSVTGVGTGLAF